MALTAPCLESCPNTGNVSAEAAAGTWLEMVATWYPDVFSDYQKISDPRRAACVCAGVSSRAHACRVCAWVYSLGALCQHMCLMWPHMGVNACVCGMYLCGCVCRIYVARL